MKQLVFFVLFIPAAIAIGLLGKEWVLPAMKSSDNVLAKLLIASGGALLIPAAFWAIVWLVSLLPDKKSKSKSA